MWNIVGLSIPHLAPKKKNKKTKKKINSTMLIPSDRHEGPKSL